MTQGGQTDCHGQNRNAMDKTETGLRQTNISWNDNDREKMRGQADCHRQDRVGTNWHWQDKLTENQKVDKLSMTKQRQGRDKLTLTRQKKGEKDNVDKLSLTKQRQCRDKLTLTRQTNRERQCGQTDCHWQNRDKAETNWHWQDKPTEKNKMDRLMAMDKTETGLRQTSISWNDNDRQRKDEWMGWQDRDRVGTNWHWQDRDRAGTNWHWQDKPTEKHKVDWLIDTRQS